MIKKSILIRQLKRKKLIILYKTKRNNLKKNIKDIKSLEDLYSYYKKIQKLPRDSSSVRFNNRCWKTGKARGYYRFFGLCRIALRELALTGFLPGIIKSSW